MTERRPYQKWLDEIDKRDPLRKWNVFWVGAQLMAMIAVFVLIAFILMEPSTYRFVWGVLNLKWN